MEVVEDAKGLLKDSKYIRPLFSTLVDNRKMWIYERKETHKNGERNDSPNNWWLMYEQMDGSYSWIPWVDKFAKRPCFEFKIRENNHVKFKWDEHDVRSGVFCEIFLNGDKVYEFGARDVEYAAARAVVLKSEIMGSPFDFSNPDKEVGRKVYYKDEPAIVEMLILDQGCVILKKDGSGDFKRAVWDDDDWDEAEPTIKEDILSSHIWWFRDED